MNTVHVTAPSYLLSNASAKDLAQHKGTEGQAGERFALTSAIGSLRILWLVEENNQLDFVFVLNSEKRVSHSIWI